MNSKGQVFFVTIMIALVFIIMAMAFAPPLKSFTDTAMNASTTTTVGLDCSNTNISKFDKANCLFVDYQTPYFVGFLIFVAGAIIVARLTL